MTKYLTVYNVYAKNGNIQDVENLVFVKEGWSWTAAILNIFWAGYHGLWWVFVGLFVVQVIFMAIGLPKEAVLQDVVTVAKMGFMAFVGCNAADWQIWSLQRKGYQCVDIVTGNSETEAQYKVLSHYTEATNLSSVTV